ncbi:MAG: LPS assembly lipoprotein LptE [Betaproteobacteria bacterium]
MQRRTLALTAPLALLLGGCGFALRKAPNYAFRSIYLQLPEASSLGPLLTRALQFSPELRVLTASAQRAGADVVLEVRSEQREKVVAGLNAAGQVREFVLRLRLRFRLITPAGRELIPESELLLQREVGFAETAALAKEEEEALLYRDMRNDMVQQLMRRLAAVTSLTAGALPPER